MLKYIASLVLFYCLACFEGVRSVSVGTTLIANGRCQNVWTYYPVQQANSWTSVISMADDGSFLIVLEPGDNVANVTFVLVDPNFWVGDVRLMIGHYPSSPISPLTFNSRKAESDFFVTMRKFLVDSTQSFGTVTVNANFNQTSIINSNWKTMVYATLVGGVIYDDETAFLFTNNFQPGYSWSVWRPDGSSEYTQLEGLGDVLFVVEDPSMEYIYIWNAQRVYQVSATDVNITSWSPVPTGLDFEGVFGITISPNDPNSFYILTSYSEPKMGVNAYGYEIDRAQIGNPNTLQRSGNIGFAIGKPTDYEFAGDYLYISTSGGDIMQIDMTLNNGAPTFTMSCTLVLPPNNGNAISPISNIEFRAANEMFVGYADSPNFYVVNTDNFCLPSCLGGGKQNPPPKKPSHAVRNGLIITFVLLTVAIVSVVGYRTYKKRQLYAQIY
eukprot:TRINITY_DN4823_c0_g1_i4.p1 TRINITY_DN4823_c0_g1~~TRINITY_DN4823_c0_g1_i4.p1  ORF type:complete len:441 (-),score=65.45 TRINITY_DN4823_c0_g1_i4:62-1384(-)